MLSQLKKMLVITGFSGFLFVTFSIQAQAATNTVTVQKGDTLWGIAIDHRITVSDLKKWNHLKSDLIRPGLTLMITDNVQQARNATNHLTKNSVSKKDTKHVKQAKLKSSSLKVTKTVNVRVSAYTIATGSGTGYTTTGFNLKTHPYAKVIAVDSTVIPLGSKVYVPDYGVAIAEDTGGAIYGNRIDVYMISERKALDFGIKHIKVSILK